MSQDIQHTCWLSSPHSKYDCVKKTVLTANQIKKKNFENDWSAYAYELLDMILQPV